MEQRGFQNPERYCLKIISFYFSRTNKAYLWKKVTRRRGFINKLFEKKKNVSILNYFDHGNEAFRKIMG